MGGKTNIPGKESMKEKDLQQMQTESLSNNKENKSSKEEMLIQEMCKLWIEDARVEVEKKNRDLNNVRWDLCVLENVLSSKYRHFQWLYSFLKAKWQPKHGFEMKKTESGIYIFQFNHQMDIQKMLKGQPWVFNKSPILI